MSSMTRMLAAAGAVFGLLAGPLPGAAQDAGGELYDACATCHGAEGEGGPDGVYPRLAALPEGYIAAQLRHFVSRERVNKPMIPVFEDGRLDGARIDAVARLIAGMDPPVVEPPDYEPRPETLAYLGDRSEVLAVGREMYAKDCSLCHGDRGEGKEDTENPPLRGQHLAYLEKQMRDFAQGRRWHEFSAALFAELESEEVDALLFYLATLNGPGPVR